MPTSEQHAQTRQPEELKGMPEQLEQQFRTIAVRVPDNVHSQLAFIAQLAGTNLSEEIRRAIDVRISTAQDDPDLIQRAREVREQIEREAAARSAAIAGFMGQTAVTAVTTKSTGRSQRNTKTETQ